MTVADFDFEAAMRGCLVGDRSALQRLYDQEVNRLLGVAFRIVRDRQLAEDVVQDAFVQIWTRAATFDPKLGSARGWIYTIVRHRALREVQRPGAVRRVELDDLDSLAAAEANDPTDTDLSADALRRCLERLEPERRQCIEAAFVEGYTQHELAQRLDKPLGTVKSWIRRGLISLRECLQ